jgi:predicted TIM-barrel fold metal-dependent hydrolase
MAGKYRVISADSHLELSPNVWTHWVPVKWRDQAPRLIKLANGRDAVVLGDAPPRPMSAQGVRHLIPNVPRSQLHLQNPNFEAAAGTRGPEQRLKEQDQDGVDAEVFFSHWNRMGQLKDPEGNRALTHAYNQYLAEEYSVVARDRLIPVGVMPNTGIEDALSELEYCARVGMRGILLDAYPSGNGYPTPEDDRFWAACRDLRMPVTNHWGGGGTRMGRADQPIFNYPEGVQLSAHGPNSDPIRDLFFRFCDDSACAAVQLAFAGVFDRFPELQIYWAETMAGWIKYTMFQIDDDYERYKYMAQDLYGLESLERLPSEYLRDNNLWGFLYDPVGVADREVVGADRLMWGSDFPHVASDWPNSTTTLERNFAGVPADERYLMTAGNAIRFFRLDDS